MEVVIGHDTADIVDLLCRAVGNMIDGHQMFGATKHTTERPYVFFKGSILHCSSALPLSYNLGHPSSADDNFAKYTTLRSPVNSFSAHFDVKHCNMRSFHFVPFIQQCPAAL